MIDRNDAVESIIPLRIIEQEIASHTARRPSAMMVPLSFYPEYDMIFGLHVIRGDRFALLYEAP